MIKISQELLNGVYVLNYDRVYDSRGSMAIPFHTKEFSTSTEQDFKVAQVMISRSNSPLCVRGLHYQSNSAPVKKIVTCTEGLVWDVVVDLRHESATYGEWAGVFLSHYASRQVYIPHGVAHGYVTIMAPATIMYFQDGLYNEEESRIIQWDDPGLGVEWHIGEGIEAVVLSGRDRDCTASWEKYKLNPDF